MTSKTFDLTTPDGVCDTYVSYPDAGGPFPAVLFFMDGIGIRPVLHEMADRIASNGFYVLLPNMFYRAGRAPVIDPKDIMNPANRPKLMELIGGLTPDKVISDATTFLDYLAAQKEVKPGKVGLTGYCMGGGMVMRTTAAFPDRIAAGGIFHAGRLVTDDPKSPHKLAPQIKAELYFGHADQDQGMTPENIKNLDAALDAAKVKYQTELYTGAMHGYTMSDMPVYNESATRKHWHRLLDLFERTLKAA